MVQEITTRSFGSRISNAIGGIIIGLLLIIGSFVLVFWNEGQGLHTAQSLEEAGKILISIPVSPLNPINNHHVVYLTGKATPHQTLQDKLFSVRSTSIRLQRKVEMYQWKQESNTTTEKQFGGSEREVTNYTYKHVWSEHLINSSNFKEPQGHENPADMPITSRTEQAQHVTVGDFFLSRNLIDKISNATPIDPNNLDLTPLKDKIKLPITVENELIYAGENSDQPAIGDMKFTLTEVLPQEVSIIAEQDNNRLIPFTAHAGKNVSLLEMGQQTPTDMINHAEHENTIIMFVLRLTALLMMIFGFLLLMQPIVVLADIVPLFGSLVGFGTGLIAFLAGLILWTIATAIAWFAFRPLWAIGLIIIVLGTCYLVIFSRSKKKSSA